MTSPRQADVLVIGAGPAGAVTALKLAGAGADVLIVDEHDEPAGSPSCDMIVGAPALSALAELGIALPHQPRAGIELKLGGAPWRTLDAAEAASCDRTLLRAALLRSALAAGAVLLPGTASRPARHPGGYLTVVGAQELTARHLVLATGAPGPVGPAPASGPLAAGPPPGPTPGAEPPGAGVACARRFAVPGPASAIRLLMAAPDGDGDPPVSAWVVPGPDGTVTIGAARIGADAVPGELMAAALRALAGADDRLAGARPAGPLVSGPLNSGFSPRLLAGAGNIVVGEAAGLASPFTGEGLSAAIHSGLLAASAVAEHQGDPDAARRGYASRAARTFVGYFEVARHAARRYQLTWRILSAAADSDHPFYAKARRAIVAPEGRSPGTQGAAPRRSSAVPLTDMPLTGPFLAACDEVALTTIRGEWPSLAHLALAGGGSQDAVRPARLFLAGLLSGQDRPDIRLATPAAAIELATLGALAFISAPQAPVARRGVDWATATTVLVGDFLVSQASRLIAEAAPEVSWSFADWLAELAALRAAPPTAREECALAVFAALLEFPARIGAVLGGAPPDVVQAVRDAGHHCGHALVHADDILLLSGLRSRLDTTLPAALASRISAIPDLVDGRPATPESLAADPVLRSAALAAANASCRTARDHALRAAAAIPAPIPSRMLRQFTHALAAPACSAEIPASAELCGSGRGPKSPLKQ